MKGGESSSIHAPPDELRHVQSLYKKGCIDYHAQYIWLYIAYSAWYQRSLGTTNDREAVSLLKKRFVIWDDYLNKKTMQRLTPYMERLAELTQREPLRTNALHWSGELHDKHDWRSLIEFWFQVRCLIVHGSSVSPRYVWLAYETLDVFMLEIIERMQSASSVESTQLTRLQESESVSLSEQVRASIHARYITSPDIWQVDMQRV